MKSGTGSASAWLMIFCPSCSAALVDVWIIRLPAKRAVSTCASAAMTTASARSISSSVKRFFAPTEPWVSIRISCPSAAADFLSASAAMKVCAMPVGQEVTPTRNCRLLTGAGAGVAGAASATVGISASAFSITARVLVMPALTGTASIGLPANRSMPTWMSEATITTSAAATSSAESWFLIPSEPWVSTLIWCPMTAAVFLSASAAISVWATPVGQPVIATIFAMGAAPRSGLLQDLDLDLGHQFFDLDQISHPWADTGHRVGTAGRGHPRDVFQRLLMNHGVQNAGDHGVARADRAADGDPRRPGQHSTTGIDEQGAVGAHRNNHTLHAALQEGDGGGADVPGRFERAAHQLAELVEIGLQYLWKVVEPAVERRA